MRPSPFPNRISAIVSVRPAASHKWHFFRAGGFDQVCIDTGADLLALGQLDQKLWSALSCPTQGIEFDARTLDFVDSDKDGHIRAAEIIAAARWAAELLRDPDLLARRCDALPLPAIDTEREEGRHILAAARHILQGAGKADAGEISAGDTENAWSLVAAMRFNGDGIVPPQAAGDEALAAAIEDIMRCCGSLPDRSGEPGISAEIAERFFAQAEAFSAWWREAENDSRIWFLGADTLAASDAFHAVAAKVEDYFVRCRLAAYDPRAAAGLSRTPEDYQALSALNLADANAEISAFPLAAVGAHAPLPLTDALNPAWLQAMQDFRDRVVTPLLGARESLAEQEWAVLRHTFSALQTWLAHKPALSDPEQAQSGEEQLGIARIRAILYAGTPAAIRDLIAQDEALKAETDAIASLDKLVHYCRDLHALAENFVSFRDFYIRKGKATFQAGTLYLDGRSCELCVRVADVDKHATLANLSRVCLAYCECVRNGGAERMFIAAAFTAGDSDQLVAGRNGVFYDRQGRDWDATIVRMLDHPISIRQSFWAPYKRAAKMISEQIQKFAAARSQAAETRMIATAVESVNGKPPPPKPPFDVAKFAGIFAAIGLAVGALGTAIASMLTGLMGLKWWQLPIVAAALLLAISGPAMLIAWLKLRQRNLGPILDANGWAVNARAKINIPFGTSLTGIAQLPKGTDRSLADPYAEKKTTWPYYLAGVLTVAALAWYLLH